MYQWYAGGTVFVQVQTGGLPEIRAKFAAQADFLPKVKQSGYSILLC